MDDGLPEHRKYKHHDITQMSKAPNYKTLYLPQENDDKFILLNGFIKLYF
jgi:hypothetical protein